MCFWQVFAAISFVVSLVFRGGAGIIIGKKRSDPNSPAEPPRTSGPGWRLVSTKTYGVKTTETDAKADAPARDASPAETSGPDSSDP
ncbi:MAG: hypothetical protein AAGM22_33530 [Acidobacteriota bacterium]